MRWRRHASLPAMALAAITPHVDRKFKQVLAGAVIASAPPQRGFAFSQHEPTAQRFPFVVVLPLRFDRAPAWILVCRIIDDIVHGHGLNRQGSATRAAGRAGRFICTC